MRWVPSVVSLWSALGSLSYSVNSDITKPGVQKPHCEAWHSTIACCTGCGAPSWSFRSSTVSSWAPSSWPTNRMQALTAW